MRGRESGICAGSCCLYASLATYVSLGLRRCSQLPQSRCWRICPEDWMLDLGPTLTGLGLGAAGSRSRIRRYTHFGRMWLSWRRTPHAKHRRQRPLAVLPMRHHSRLARTSCGRTPLIASNSRSALNPQARQAEAVDAFDLRSNVIEDYSSYVRSFLPIPDDCTRELVDTAQVAADLRGSLARGRRRQARASRSRRVAHRNGAGDLRNGQTERTPGCRRSRPPTRDGGGLKDDGAQRVVARGQRSNPALREVVRPPGRPNPENHRAYHLQKRPVNAKP